MDIRNKHIPIKKIAITLFFILSSYLSFGQQFDTAQVILNAKMNLFEFRNSYTSESDLINIVKSKCKYRFLQSKGFEDVVFFEITFAGNFEKWLAPPDSLNYLFNINLVDTKFIFGYNLINYNLYRLKGLKTNDFNELYFFLKLAHDVGDLDKKGDFLEDYQIEGIDLECLYKWQKYLERTAKKRRKRRLKEMKLYNCAQPPIPLFSGVVW